MDFKAGDQSLLIKKVKALIMFELPGPAVITGWSNNKSKILTGSQG